METHTGSRDSYQAFANPHGICSFRSPREVLFGVDSLSRVGEAIDELGGKKVFVITAPLIMQHGIADRLVNHLKKHHLHFTVSCIESREPTDGTAYLMRQKVIDSGSDVVIGIGGGSVLDVAKYSSITEPGESLREQLAGVKTSAVNLKVQDALPKILIPTTSGTGSEATYSSVLAIGKTKVSVRSKHFLAEVAIVDPSLTLTLPPKITAMTGVDALSHAVEAFISRNASTLSDTLGLRSVELIFGNLEAAYSDGSNITARSNMSLAALLSGLSFGSAGNVLGHSLAYALAQVSGTPHGLSVGVSLPYSILWNMHACEDKLRFLAERMKWNVAEHEAAGVEVAHRVRSLLQRIGLPWSLREMDITPDILSEIVELATSTYYRAGNPTEVSKPLLEEMLAESL